MYTCHGISTVVLFPSHHINEISKRQGSELNSPLSNLYEPVPDLGHGGYGGSVDATQNLS